MVQKALKAIGCQQSIHIDQTFSPFWNIQSNYNFLHFFQFCIHVDFFIHQIMPARPAGQELGHEIGAADVQSPLRLRGRAAHRVQQSLTGLGPRPHHADGPAQPC